MSRAQVRFYAALLAVGVAAVIGPAQGAESVASLDTIDQRVMPCSACHGKEGRATNDGYYPRIAGKPAGYLYHQLLNFRAGRRHNAQMSYLLERQSDDYLREMAQYFAGQSLPYPTPVMPEVDASRLARGETLVRRGDASKRLPACQGCHGERLTGTAPDVPGLVGMPYDYLVAQFGSWRESNRRTVAPDCMAEITHRMSAEDIGAVAAWLASQNVPEDPHPARDFTQKPPMACGSIDPVTAGAP